MKNKMISLFLLGGMAVGCESSGSGQVVDIPTVRIECSEAKCTDISNVGSHDAVVTFTRSGCAPDQVALNPEVIGNASVVCNTATGCIGTVSSWTNASSDAVATIESKNYDVCGWIDLDDNADDSTADVFFEDSQTVTAATLTLTDWSVTYSSRQKVHQNR